MRAALILLVLVLGGAAGLMYVTSWRNGGASPEAGGDARAAAADSAPSLVASLFAADDDEPVEAEPAPARRARAAKKASAPPPEIWYQWTDERGSVRFASTLAEVPERWRKRAGKIEMSPIQRTSTPPPRRASRRATAPDPKAGGLLDQIWGATASDDGEIIIYTTSWCGACDRAKSHMDDKGVAYVEKDIEDDAAAEDEFLQKSGGRRGVPLIDVYGQIMHGFSPQRLDQLIQRRG